MNKFDECTTPKRKRDEVAEFLKLALLNYSLVSVDKQIQEPKLLLWRKKILKSLGVKGEITLQKEIALIQRNMPEIPYSLKDFENAERRTLDYMSWTINPIRKLNIKSSYIKQCNRALEENETAISKKYVYRQVLSMLNAKRYEAIIKINQLSKKLSNEKDEEKAAGVKKEMEQLIKFLGYNPLERAATEGYIRRIRPL